MLLDNQARLKEENKLLKEENKERLDKLGVSYFVYY